MQSATSLPHPAMNPSPVVLPDDLIADILSFLPVKSLLKFRCVNKSWKTIISDSNFVKMHLKRSTTRNPLFTLVTEHLKHIRGESSYGSDDETEMDTSVLPYSIRRLIDNPSFTLFDDRYFHVKNKGCYHFIASRDGLILLAGDNPFNSDHSIEYWLRLWNPSTRTISNKFGYFRDFGHPQPNTTFPTHYKFHFNFGYHNSTNTYKVVASCYNRRQLISYVRILSFGDLIWRDIESFPIAPLNYEWCHSVYLSGTLNWLAIHNNLDYYFQSVKNIRVEYFLIVSLDLGTETYNQYMLPHGFNEVPPAEPTIGVLGDCLCFSHSYKETDFIIWQMKKFAVEESWTQFIKISYQNLQINYDFSDGSIKYHFQLVPLLLSEDGDTVILKSSQEFEAILYNLRDSRVERTNITASRTITDSSTGDGVCWYSVRDYVESLVPIL